MASTAPPVKTSPPPGALADWLRLGRQGPRAGGDRPGAHRAQPEPILEANALDLEAGRGRRLSDALLDRLALDTGRIAAMAAGVRKIAALPDPVGEVIDGSTLPKRPGAAARCASRSAWWRSSTRRGPM